MCKLYQLLRQPSMRRVIIIDQHDGRLAVAGQVILRWALSTHAPLYIFALGCTVTVHSTEDTFLFIHSYHRYTDAHICQPCLKQDSRFDERQRLVCCPKLYIAPDSRMNDGIQLLQFVRIGKHLLRYVACIIDVAMVGFFAKRGNHLLPHGSILKNDPFRLRIAVVDGVTQTSYHPKDRGLA